MTVPTGFVSIRNIAHRRNGLLGLKNLKARSKLSSLMSERTLSLCDFICLYALNTATRNLFQVFSLISMGHYIGRPCKRRPHTFSVPTGSFLLVAVTSDGGGNRNRCGQCACQRQMDARRKEWVDEGLNCGLKLVERRYGFLRLPTSCISNDPPSISSISVRRVAIIAGGVNKTSVAVPGS